MSEQTRQEMLLPEDFFSTPDMGEYLNNNLTVAAAEELVGGMEDAEFFLEAPFSEVLGYHQSENVFVLSGDPISKTNTNFDETSNTFDGDTTSISFDNIQDGGQSFYNLADQKTYSSPKAYLSKILGVDGTANSDLKIRTLGLDAPELPHFRWLPLGDNPKIIEVKLRDLVEKSYVTVDKFNSIIGSRQIETSKFSYVKYAIKYDETTGKDSVAGKRSLDEVIPFAVVSVHNMATNKEEEAFYEVMRMNGPGSDYYCKNIEGLSNKTYRCCVVSGGNLNDLEYHKQAIESRDETIKMFKNASEIRYVLDGTVIKKYTGQVPNEYRKSFEKIDAESNPFEVFSLMCQNLTQEGYTYYSKMRYSYFGMDNNGRCLGAIYLKVPTSFGNQWINLGKYLLFKYDRFVANRQYTNSPTDTDSYGFNADVFKIWTYDRSRQVYLDKFFDTNAKNNGDDRAEIQKAITGMDLNEMSNHTVMIGDVLMMVPPTSIRYVSQTNAARVSMLRAKGTMSKSMPKSLRLIEMNLYFNGEDQINGIPYEQKTPSGDTMTYYMNGLRALIAQFKFTPYVPILNEYINNVLGIDAVALVSYDVNTMPNYPTTLQVTVRLQEFDWQQYMPELLPPNADDGEDIYTNLFAKTIHFPVFRYYYQKALMKGQDLLGEDPSSSSYVESTLGDKTALQPMGFDSHGIKFYIPNEEHLKMKKQLKIQLETTPLETTYTFTESENNFLREIAKMHTAVVKRLKSAQELADTLMQTTDNEKYYLQALPLQSPMNEYNNFMILDGPYVCNNMVESTWGVLKGQKVQLNGLKITKTRSQVKAECFDKITAELRKIENDRDIFDTSIIQECSPTAWTRKSKVNGKVSINMYWGVKIRFDFGKVGLATFEEKLVSYAIKQLNCREEDLYLDKDSSDKYIRIGLVSNFLEEDGIDLSNTYPQITKFKANTYSPDDTSTIGYDFINLMAANFADGNGGIEDEDMFNSQENIGDMKDNIDLETASSLIFEEYPIGNPIITKMNFTYNNVFANLSMQSYDGYASQYTGGSDTTCDIIMQTRDEFTVNQFHTLSKICVQYIIDYRKVLTTSPLRIDSELSRFMGVNEVIIESIDINTVPNIPGLFEISLRLVSANRTLRNREALKKLDVDNSETSYSQLIKTKNYFELNNTLAKVDLYPDLELPTIAELEKLGWYFIRYKSDGARVFPDPDFYFVYLQLYTSEMIREAVVQFFSDETNFEISKEFSGDLFKERAIAKMKLNNEDTTEIITYEQDATNEYSKELQNMYSNITAIMDNSDSYSKKVKDKVNKLQDKASRRAELLNKLQENIEAADYNSYDFNPIYKVSVTDSIPYSKATSNLTSGSIEMFDGNTSKAKLVKTEVDDVSKAANKTLKRIIRRILKKPINNMSDFDEFTEYYAKSIIGYHDANTVLTIKNGHGLMLSVKGAIQDVIKAAGRGATAKYGVGDKTLGDKYKSTEARSVIVKTNTTGAPIKVYNSEGKEVTVANGETYKIKHVYYQAAGQGLSDFVLATTKEEFDNGVVFGKYAIRKYTPSFYGNLFDKVYADGEDGFLDPYYNKKLYKDLFEGEKAYEEDVDWNQRLNEYRDIITSDDEKADCAIFRVMLIWLYKLMNAEGNPFLPDSLFLLRDLDSVKSESYELDDNVFVDAWQWMQKQYYSAKSYLYSNDGDSSWAIFKDDEQKALEAQLQKEALQDDADTERELNKTVQGLYDQLTQFKMQVGCGVFVTLGLLAITDNQTSVMSSLLGQSLGQYVEFIEKIKTAYQNPEGLSEAEIKVRKYFLSLDEKIDNDAEYKSIATEYSLSSKLQRLYLRCAEDPSIYIMHSFYDMVMNDKRGRMARAFPTYYMLLIDEGRDLGVWKLQDNFYDVSSITEFQVVRSRKIAADTAKICMTNLYGTYTTEDEDIKDEYQYTFKDAWNSIFSPRNYYTKEYNRRSNARQFNRCNLKAGARVHLRAGYGANAADIPILFNGVVTEVEPGDIMTIVCQGDGVELANPNMFNPADKAKDVADLENQDKLFKRFLNAFDNNSTPRDILINPLVVEGTWIQEIIKGWTDGRLFNSNPFGIVHFGDKRFNAIFENNGEVEQNIYEATSKPSWHKSVNNNTASLYSLDSAPKIRVGLHDNRSYWDLMNLAASVSPDFICAIAPFQMRSTIFYGHPRYYYAYDYTRTSTGKIIEKRKPFQQFHVLTSYSDIVSNGIRASANDVRTCAVGVYTGDGVLSSKTKKVGPLYLDIDIYPEYQKMTTINCNFQSKLGDMPFTIPIAGWAYDEFFDGGGYQTAWRATAHGLKETVKDMYTGELAVIGDPVIKPYDRVMIFDSYEDIQGMVEVETVVHSFTVDNGFITSITPDLIAAIDDKTEQVATSVFKEIMAPVLTSHATLCLMSRKWRQITRNLFFSASKSIKFGVDVAQGVVGQIATIIGNEDIAKYSKISDKLLGKLGLGFGVTELDYKVYNQINSLSKAYKAIKTSHSVTGATSLIDLLDDLANLPANVEATNVTALEKQLKEALVTAKGENATAIQKALDSLSTNADEYANAIKYIDSNLKIEKSTIDKIIKSAEASLDGKDAAVVKEIKEAITELKKMDGIKYTTGSTKFAEQINTLKKVAAYADDVDDLADDIKALDKIFDGTKNTIKSLANVADDLKDINNIVKGMSSIAASIGPQILWLIAEIVITKSIQEQIERFLKNLQVMTLFPIMKNNKVMVAGIDGHKGSVFGSLTYDTPGYVENMIIKFADSSGIGKFAFDFFLGTSEMTEIVDSYRRNSEYEDYANTSEQGLRDNFQSNLLLAMARDEVKGMSTYKELFLTSRVSPSSTDGSATVAFHANKVVDILNIESSSAIDKELNYIFEEGVLAELRENKKIMFGAEQNASAEQNGITIKNDTVVIQPSVAGGNAREVAAQIIKGSNSNGLDVWDIPYLRADAIIVLEEIIKNVIADLRTDKSTYDDIEENQIIVHNCARINESSKWSCTGLMFTLEVKNYDNLSNILKEMSNEQNNLINISALKNKVFDYKKDTNVGPNVFRILVSPRSTT